MIMLDSGVVEIYSVENNSERGAYPVEHVTLKCRECFETRVVGMSRYYAARQVNVTVDRMIRIWRNDTLTTQDVAKIDGVFFKIQQIQHSLDKDEMPVSDLTLERTVQRYDA